MRLKKSGKNKEKEVTVHQEGVDYDINIKVDGKLVAWFRDETLFVDKGLAKDAGISLEVRE